MRQIWRGPTLSKKLTAIVLSLIIVLCVVVSFGHVYLTHFDLPVHTDNTVESYYTANAIWIQNQGWPRMNPDILENNLSSVVATLNGSHIRYAFVFVGYWNSTTNDIDYTISDELINATIEGLHQINMTVLAWAETQDANLDVTAANRENLYSSIVKCMDKGFDGYNDDVEGHRGSMQDWIDYLNNAAVVLHDADKLMTADVACDWQQNTNPYLHIDYIVSMFYSDKSTFEDPQAAAYWEENFGQYMGNNNPPASPVILGIMNYYGNAHSLSWQLQKLDNSLSNYNHPQLEGFSIWLYEYMGTNPDDWQQWNNWITRPHG
jgi:hypothetical protein